MSRNYTEMRRYEQLLDQLDAATSRLESRFDEIERRVTKLQVLKSTHDSTHGQQRYAGFEEGVNNAAWSPPPPPRRRRTCWDPPLYKQPLYSSFPRGNSSNYETDSYQQPTRLRPCHEQPPGWPPPQRSPPSCWPAQRRRHAYGKQQQTHAAPRRQPTCLDLPERPIQQGVSAYNPQPPTGGPLGQQPSSLRRPTRWDMPGQQGYQSHEQPARMEPPDCILRPLLQPPQLHCSRNALHEERCLGEVITHSQSSKYASNTNEMREQEEEMFDSPSLDPHMEYSFDNAKDFNYSPKNEMVVERSDNLCSSFLMDSRLETEVDEVDDHGASNLDVAGVSNPSIALLHGVEEDRDASPEAHQVSSSGDIYLSCSSSETNTITTMPLPAVAFLHIEGDFRFLLQENACDEGGVCLRIGNPVVQEYIGKNLVYVADVCGTLGAYSSFRPKSITSGRVKDQEFDYEENLGLLQLALHVPDAELCKWRSSPFDDHISPSWLIFDGSDEGRSSVVWYPFDPGGDVSPKLLLSTLSVASWFPP